MFTYLGELTGIPHGDAQSPLNKSYTITAKIEIPRDDARILRWTAAGVVEAERHFRKLAGFRALPKLVGALRAHDAALDRALRVKTRKEPRR